MSILNRVILAQVEAEIAGFDAFYRDHFLGSEDPLNGSRYQFCAKHGEATILAEKQRSLMIPAARKNAADARKALEAFTAAKPA